MIELNTIDNIPMEIDYDIHKHYELKVKKEIYVKKGLSGLVNFGNICFMVSILQCLNNTLSLTDYILYGKYKEDVRSNCKEKFVLISFVNLVVNMWETNQLIKPKTLVENISIFHRKYFALEQQDSHEFLMYLLEILHKSLCYEVDIEESKKESSTVLIKKSVETWKKLFEKEYSIIIQTFYGNTLNTIICANGGCQMKEQLFESYNCLQLDIDNKGSLYECLDGYFLNEELVMDWKCEKCKMRGCKKDTKIWMLPNYMIIHLKRFSKTGLQKNTNMITYPLRDLNLTKYISQEKNDNNKYIYDLYAVNYHNGNMNFGHYWSVCRNLDGKWYNFNDGNVSRVADEQIVSNDAYILFYYRKFIRKPIEI
jgi:ubiquitin C-terminal hydrolase